MTPEEIELERERRQRIMRGAVSAARAKLPEGTPFAMVVVLGVEGEEVPFVAGNPGSAVGLAALFTSAILVIVGEGCTPQPEHGGST